jgi:hypothetical protein
MIAVILLAGGSRKPAAAILEDQARGLEDRSTARSPRNAIWMLVQTKRKEAS